MSESEGGPKPDEVLWESDQLKTGREKALAATELGWKAIRAGMKKEDAGNRAIHELKHSLEDKGDQGKMALVERPNGKLRAQYNPNRQMSLEEEEAALLAAGSDMSDADQVRLNQIRNKKRSLLYRLFGL